jgi:hypothetical protein
MDAPLSALRSARRALAARTGLFFDGVQGIHRDVEVGEDSLEIGAGRATTEVRLMTSEKV